MTNKEAPPPLARDDDDDAPKWHADSGKRGRAFLREPVPEHMVSILVRQTAEQKEEIEKDRRKGIRCEICKGWHHEYAVHLSYVGHAAATALLLEADLDWTWEPVAWTPDGLPRFDATGGLWIWLHVGGFKRLGYGNAQGKAKGIPGDREKEVIGDAIRNAAMRFGLALQLWSKEDLDLSSDEDEEEAAEQRRRQAAAGEGSQETAPPAASKPAQPAAKTSQPAAAGEATVRSARPYPQADFERNFKAWSEALLAGTKTIDETLAMIRKRGILSAEQEKRLRDVVKPANT